MEQKKKVEERREKREERKEYHEPELRPLGRLNLITSGVGYGDLVC